MNKHFIVIFIILVLSSSVYSSNSISGQITGRIIDRESRNPIRGANIIVKDRFTEAVSDSAGSFSIPNLTPGIYSLQISHIGYKTIFFDSITVSSSNTVELAVELEPGIIELKGIVVSPGSYNLMGDAPTSNQTLTSKEIQTTPQLADDFFRAVNHLLEMTSNDFSTRFSIRGGEFDEILVTLDGMELNEPFHLKDIDGGAMSIIDVAALDGINLMTGGFPSNYGNKMSGILEVKSRSVQPGKSRLSAGISLLNTRILSEGTFAKNSGSWLFSARRGYIDYVLKLTDADNNIKPTYYDVYGKVQYRLNENHVLAANFLHAQDKLHFYGEDEDTNDTLVSKYGSTYGWISLWSQLHKKLSAHTLIAFGKTDHNRRGQNYRGGSVQYLAFSALNKNDTDFLRWKTDMEFDLSKSFLMKFGGEFEEQNATYEYQCRNYTYGYNFDSGSYYLARIDSLDTSLKPSGSKFGTYSTIRWRLATPLFIESGLRYDHVSYTNENIISPRLSFSYQLNERTTFRAAWGIYNQSERIDEIAVGDGEKSFSPTEQAEHRIIGFEHEFASGVRMRIEAYQKKYSHLRPAYRNTFESIELFPEREYDRTLIARQSANSRGVELFLKKDVGGKFTWWLSYAIAKVDEKVDSIYFPREHTSMFYDFPIPTPQDQRYTLCFDAFYRPSPRWQLSAAFQYHTGWPYTDVYLMHANTPQGTVYWIQSATQWGARFKPFHRLDIRMDRYFPVKRGKIALFIELLNVYNHKNIRGYEYGITGWENNISIDREPSYWLGILPSFGISYEVSL